MQTTLKVSFLGTEVSFQMIAVDPYAAESFLSLFILLLVLKFNWCASVALILYLAGVCRQSLRRFVLYERRRTKIVVNLFAHENLKKFQRFVLPQFAKYMHCS